MEAERPGIIWGEAIKHFLGLDVGERRIGVAVGDSAGIVVTPLPAIQRSGLEEDFKSVVRLTEEHQAKAVVVGIPISLNGRMGPQARLVLRFIQDLARWSRLPVYSQDERFSTVEAERLPKNQDQNQSYIHLVLPVPRRPRSHLPDQPDRVPCPKTAQPAA